MIETKDIYKTFGENQVLQGISTVFEPGKNNLIIGGSGSGKTTLLKCIVGLHEPTEGEVFYNGENFTRCILRKGALSARKSACFFKIRPCLIP